MVNSFITSIASLLTNNTDLILKTSGLLDIIDGTVQLKDQTLISNTDILNFVTGNNAITNLLLSYNDIVTIANDQKLTSTYIDPTASSITSNSTSPVYARTPSNTVTSISDTQPSDIVITPAGNEPPLSFRGQYPYVHTYKSESGHIKEVDDTPGNERLFDFHKSGTYQEINKDGRRVVKVVGDNFNVIVHNDYVYVEGSQSVYAKGNINITCLNDVSISAGGRLEINANEDIRIKGKSISLESSSGNVNIYSSSGMNITSEKDTNILSYGNTNIQSNNSTNINSNRILVASNTDINISANTSFTLNSTDDSNFKSSGKIILSSAKDYSVKSFGKLILSSSLNASLKSDKVVSVDGASYELQTGISPSGADASSAIKAGNAIVARKTGLRVAPDRDGTVPSIFEEVLQGTDDDPETATAAIESAVSSGRITREEADELTKPVDSTGEEDNSPAANIVGGGNTAGIENLPDTSISGALKLSKNYRVSDLTDIGPIFKYKLISQLGLSKSRIAGNMALLSQNILEPLRDEYGNIKINCGFRSGANIGGGQHGTGQAVDITFGTRSLDPKTMYDIASWAKNNIAFDQMILEYGNSQIWLHMSYADKNSGCKWKSNRKSILTMSGGHYKSGLQVLAWAPKS